MANFIFLGSKVTVDSDCSQKINDTCSWKKSYDQPRQHTKNPRHYLRTKFPLIKAMVFPEVMHGCGGWTIKKAECQRTDAFKLWYWRRLLTVSWTAKRSNQSTLKEISPEHSLEGLMSKLKLQYFGPPDVKNWFIWKDPDAGKDWRWEKKGTTEDEMVGWHHRLNGHELE